MQTLQRESNPRALADLLLFSGPGPYYDVRHRKMEPGLRECTALVVIPTFVPYLRLNTTTNWFGMIGKCAERSWTAATCWSWAGGSKSPAAPQRLDGAMRLPAHRRSGAVRPARSDRGHLPTQTQMVTFPYENTLAGSEVFAEGYSHLAPESDDWYGSVAGGREFTIFIKGQHFSVHETQVIAGGVQVTQDNWLAISRNLMRVTVPANAIVSRQWVTDPDPVNGAPVRHSRSTSTFTWRRRMGRRTTCLSSCRRRGRRSVRLPAASAGVCRRCTPPTTTWARTRKIRSLQMVDGDTILPPTGELLIERRPRSRLRRRQRSALTVQTSGKVIVILTGSTVLNFDSRRNAYFLFGKDYNQLNGDLASAVTNALNKGINGNVFTAPTQPLVVSGKLTIGMRGLPDRQQADDQSSGLPAESVTSADRKPRGGRSALPFAFPHPVGSRNLIAAAG